MWRCRRAPGRQLERAVARLERSLSEAGDALQALGRDAGKGAQTAYKDLGKSLKVLQRDAVKTNRALMKDLERLRAAIASPANESAQRRAKAPAKAPAKATGSARAVKDRALAPKRVGRRPPRTGRVEYGGSRRQSYHGPDRKMILRLRPPRLPLSLSLVGA